jgi:hypothetical protein
MPLKAPVKLTARTRSQSAGLISPIIRRTVVPAPLTRISIPPQASVMPSVNLAKASRSATSSEYAAAWPLRPVISAATPSAAAALRSRIATCAPAAAKARHVAAPIPLPPPVTRATFPVKSSVIARSSNRLAYSDATADGRCREWPTRARPPDPSTCARRRREQIRCGRARGAPAKAAVP